MEPRPSLTVALSEWMREDVDRFWSHVETMPDGCMVWTLQRDHHGYGVVYRRTSVRRKYKAHLVAMWLADSLPGPGLEPDHLCRNKACVNVLHLEAVTHQENLRRAFDHPLCRNGLHPMTGDNVRTESRGGGRTRRRCRECRNARQRVPVVRS